MVQGVVVESNHIININPATGEIISRVPVTLPDEIPNIVQKANDALPSWSDVPLMKRTELLKGACSVHLSALRDRLIERITTEMGKPVGEAEEEVDFAIDKDAFLDLIAEANRDVVLGAEGKGSSRSVVVRDPMGVVVVCSPWNFPVGEILLLVLPALAAGNTVIVKPSEVTPECGALVVNALASVLPPNVLQLVQGDGTIGSVLVQSPGVNMVAMTGSTAVGKSIMANCAPTLKRLVLELGGKDPMIVFGDADLDLAAKDAVRNSISNTGQVCCSIERIYVDRSIKDDFEQKVVKVASEYKVGDGHDPANKVGPMVSPMQRDRVAEQVESAVKAGAKVLYKSEIPQSEGEGAKKGTFYPVTVLSDLNQDMDIQKLETFGPVVALSSFDGSEADAVRLANDTDYGLASCVYSKDLDKARRVARKVQSGQVGINCYTLECADIACPWVGHKNSGFGYHSGMDGFRQFSVPKSLVFKGSS